MTTRKIVLLSVCVALFAVCIIQGIVGNINPVKTIKTELSPDQITIKTGAESIVIELKNNSWYVGNNGYLASKTDVDSMIKAIQEIKVLDKVGHIGTALDERYNLNDEKAKIVSAVKAGKEIASLRIGKASSTGSQTYATINGKNDIYLLSGNLGSTFGKSENDLKSKTIYTIEENDVSGASVTMGTKSWSLTNTAKKGEPALWTASGDAANIVLDQEACKSWIRNVSFLNINSWIDDNTPLPPNKLTSFQLFLQNGGQISVDIYQTGSDDNAQYIATCSMTEHKFDLTKYLTEKFTKDPDTLKAKE